MNCLDRGIGGKSVFEFESDLLLERRLARGGSTVVLLIKALFHVVTPCAARTSS